VPIDEEAAKQELALTYKNCVSAENASALQKDEILVVDSE
jgi:hypothetical protein